MKPKLIFAVDFDGTIVKNRWPGIGPLRQGSIKRLKWLQSRGHFLVLNTCRNEYLTNQVLDFMKERKVFFDGINENFPVIITHFGGDTRKILADWYFDDKSGFMGWWTVPVIARWLEWKYRKGGSLLS